MQIVDDTVVKFTLPTQLVGYVTDYLEKSEVINTKNGVSEMAVYWGLKEMSHLASVLQFKLLVIMIGLGYTNLLIISVLLHRS